MADLPTTQLEFDTNLNRLNSLLQGLGVVKEITADEIGQGVFGASNNNAGLEFGISKTNSVSYLQSRNFVTGSAGWRIDSDGNLEASSGTFRGDLSGGSIIIGTNAWHVDSSGNMWWGSDATYAASVSSNAPSISAGGLYLGVKMTATTGNRLDFTVATNQITAYSTNNYISSITWSDTELKLRMERSGGFVTLVSEDTEVLRADKQDGVTIPASLMLNTYRIAINKTGATAGVPLLINNAGSSISLDVNQTYASNNNTAVSVVNAGTGIAGAFANTNTSNTGNTLYATASGTGPAATFYSIDNASRILPVVLIQANSSRGSHLNLVPIATTPVSPAEGDIYTDTDNYIYYFNGTIWMRLNGVSSYGECYGNAIAWQQASAAQNTWYDVSDSDMTSDELLNVTHDGNGKLTLVRAGVYMVSYSFAVSSSHANEHLHFGITIDDAATPHASSHTHMETKFADQETVVSNSFLLTVTAGQTINAMIETVDAGTPTIDILDLTIIAVQIG